MFSVEELGQEIAVLAVHIDAATHRLLECIRHFDETCGWYQQGARSCAHWLAWRVGWDPATAREKVRVARALGKLPAIDQALETGKLSYAKARALTRIAKPETEAELVAMSAYATGAQLERLCRGYRRALAGDDPSAPEERTVRRRDLPGGMVRLEITLHPDEADLVMRALDCAREVKHASEPAAASADVATPTDGAPCDRDNVSAETSHWPSRADAMVAVAEGYLTGNTGTGKGGERFQVMIHVDQDPLAPDGTLAATLNDGSRVSAETFRRIACDCGLVAVSGNAANTQQLNIGRRSRQIPPAIRRALSLRDRGCRFPGCTNTRFLHGHHLRHWLHGGETSLGNLVQLCTAHHHLVHEGGWSAHLDADGALAFTAPDGRALPPEPPREMVDDAVAFLRERAADQGLELGAETNLPEWDGNVVNYDWAVGAMIGMG
jgi:Domain of unknown function (DUF222)